MHEPIPGPGGRAIALSDDLWITDDGSSWVSIPLAGVMPEMQVRSAVWAHDRWVVGGIVGAVDPLGGAPQGQGAIWWSFDARSWHRAAFEADGLSAGPLAVGAGGIIALGSRVSHGPLVLETPMWASVDGTTWQPVRYPNSLVTVVTDGLRMVAIDWTDLEELRLRESFDGFAWHDVQVLGVGVMDPADARRLDGAQLPRQPIAPVLLGDRLWATTTEADPNAGFAETRVRWLAQAGAAPGARPFPPGRPPDADDVVCSETPCG